MEVIKNKQESQLKNGNFQDILILLATTNLTLDINSLRRAPKLRYEKVRIFKVLIKNFI